MIIVYGGVQPDVDDGRRRLPSDAVKDLESRVRRLLARLRPSLVVGAAAAGADLVVADAATRLDLPLRLVLPHDTATFRSTSVASHGTEWEQRYDRILDVATVEEGSADPDADATYRIHNRHMLDEADDLLRPGEQVWALVIRPPATASSSVSDDLAERAAERGLLTLDVNPLATPETRQRAFVAMPYGNKYDPVTRRRIDCDVVFDRVYVPVLEDLDLEWQRADLEADSGLIHIDMIDALATADVVVVDLATQNSNVAYELGLRHALVDRTTVLTYPQVSSVRAQAPPFDVQPIRHVRFDRSVEGLTDAQAAGGIRALRRVIQAVLDAPEVDSPVEAWFIRDGAGRLRRRAKLDATQAIQKEAWTTVQAALRSTSLPEIRAALAMTAEPRLTEEFRRKLRLELGTALLQEGQYDDARAALSGAEPAAGHPLRGMWLQQSALLDSWEGQDREDPLPYWNRAERLLGQALVDGDSEETCGILAGIAKRRCARELAAGRRPDAVVHLDRMIDLYRRGFHADPGYYSGVNLTAALRLKFQHFEAPDQTTETWEALAVSRFYARRDQEDRPDWFWAAATLAELALHRGLLRGDLDAALVADGYRRAATLVAPPEWRRTVADQLRFFAACGDDLVLIADLIGILEP